MSLSLNHLGHYSDRSDNHFNPGQPGLLPLAGWEISFEQTAMLCGWGVKAGTMSHSNNNNNNNSYKQKKVYITGVTGIKGLEAFT